MKVSNNIKFFKFLSILNDYSDDENILSIKEINNFMQDELGVTLDRRTIYTYIEDAKNLGFDISSFNENNKGYYNRTPKLESYELKILIDCLSANKCITHKKTKEMQNKLYKLTNIYVKYGLDKSSFLEDRSKTKNEQVFYNINNIYTAIEENKKIKFNYCEVNDKRNLEYKLDDNGVPKVYVANPINLIIKNDYYYLILNLDKYEDLSYYRIDRIKNVEILNEECKDKQLINFCGTSFNAVNHVKKSFNMYCGKKEVEIKLKVNENKIINFIIDELGDNVIVENCREEDVILRFKAFYSDGLVNWILSLGASVQVISPENLKEDVLNKLDVIRSMYK